MVFAETTYEIIILYGAANFSNFWFEELAEITTGQITVNHRYSVTWKNSDTAFHTIMPITFSGESYAQKSDDLGNFDYFCILR